MSKAGAPELKKFLVSTPRVIGICTCTLFLNGAIPNHILAGQAHQSCSQRTPYRQRRAARLRPLHVSAAAIYIINLLSRNIVLDQSSEDTGSGKVDIGMVVRFAPPDSRRTVDSLALMCTDQRYRCLIRRLWCYSKWVHIFRSEAVPSASELKRTQTYLHTHPEPA